MRVLVMTLIGCVLLAAWMTLHIVAGQANVAAGGVVFGVGLFFLGFSAGASLR